MAVGHHLIAPDGWARLHLTRMVGLDSLASRLLYERSQYIKRQALTLRESVGRHSIECIDEIASQNTRQMYLTPAL
jgi:hypothetical protein